MSSSLSRSEDEEDFSKEFSIDVIAESTGGTNFQDRKLNRKENFDQALDTILLFEKSRINFN